MQSPPEKKSTPLVEIIDREEKRRRRTRLVWWSMLVIVPAVVAGAWMLVRPKPLPFAARFRTQAVTQGDVVREVRATGNLEAVTTVQVGAEVSGRIASVEVDYNSPVKQGQVLARFDRTSLQQQVMQATASVEAARAALEQAKTDRDHSKLDYLRTKALYDKKLISDADNDAAVAALRLAEQRVSAAGAQLGASQAARDLAKTTLSRGVIYAPIDGIVITKNIDSGQTVASAFQTPVLFSVAADLRKLQMVATVDEADIGELREGQSTHFTVNAYPDRTFEGRVTQVRNSPVVVQDVVTYGTVISVDNRDLALKPGMTATVNIRTAAVANVLRVSSMALRFLPPNEKPVDAPSVWVLEGTALRRVPVHPGISDGESTALAPGDLTPGMIVVVELTPEGRKAYGTGG